MNPVNTSYESCASCESLRAQAGCTDFVFEPGTGTCVLLPHAELKDIEALDNPEVVSGTIVISVQKAVIGESYE